MNAQPAFDQKMGHIKIIEMAFGIAGLQAAFPAIKPDDPGIKIKQKGSLFFKSPAFGPAFSGLYLNRQFHILKKGRKGNPIKIGIILILKDEKPRCQQKIFKTQIENQPFFIGPFNQIHQIRAVSFSRSRFSGSILGRRFDGFEGKIKEEQQTTQKTGISKSFYLRFICHRLA